MKKIELTSQEKAFVNILYGILEERAELTSGDNGAILPETIVNKIIKKVYDICPIYQLATRYNVGGILNIPYYDETTQSFNVAYTEDFVELESSSGKLLTVKLSEYLAGVFTKASKSLFNNSEFNIIDFVVDAMARSISRWLENEIINSTANKILGLTTVIQKIMTASSTKITADELINLQDTIMDEHQLKSVWIMNRATRNEIRKLKDSQGRYILNTEYQSRWGYTLLGKDVYTSASMPTMLPGKTTVYYGDMSGLAIKFPENIEVNVLKEKYSNEHAIGIVSWIEVDSKIEDTTKIAAIVMSEE